MSFDDEEDKRGLGDRIRGGDLSFEVVGLASEGRGDLIMVGVGVTRVAGGGKDPGIEGSSGFDRLLPIGLSSTFAIALVSNPAKTSSKVPWLVTLSAGGK